LVAELSESSTEDHDHSTEEDHDEDELEVSSTVWGLVIGANVLAGAAAMVGLVLFSLMRGMGDRTKAIAMQLATAFGSGALLSAAIVHLIPEGYALIESFVDGEQLGTNAGLTILGGLMFSLILHMAIQHKHAAVDAEPGCSVKEERAAVAPTSTFEASPGGDDVVEMALEAEAVEGPPEAQVHVEGDSCDDECGLAATNEVGDCNDCAEEGGGRLRQGRSAVKLLAALPRVGPVRGVRPQAWNLVLGDCICNGLDGMVIAVAFAGCDSSMGWIVFGAVMSHEIPQEIGDFFVLIDSGLSFGQALLANLFSGVCAIFGGIIVLLLNSSLTADVVGYMLLFGSGMFLFAGAAELLPELLAAPGGPKLAVARAAMVALGAAAVVVSLMSHAHCDAGFLGAAHAHHDDHGDTHDDH